MDDLLAFLLIGITGGIATALAWAIFYASTRRRYRDADDHENETPPPGWPSDYQWVICTHCDRGWWKRPEDDNGCPYCPAGSRPPVPARHP